MKVSVISPLFGIYFKVSLDIHMLLVIITQSNVENVIYHNITGDNFVLYVTTCLLPK